MSWWENFRPPAASNGGGSASGSENGGQPTPAEVFAFVSGAVGSVLGGIGIVGAEQSPDGQVTVTADTGQRYVATAGPGGTVDLSPQPAIRLDNPLLLGGGLLLLAVLLLR